MIHLIDNEDAITIVIDSNAIGMLELAWLVAFLAERGHERAFVMITREYLHSIIASVNNQQ